MNFKLYILFIVISLSGLTTGLYLAHRTLENQGILECERLKVGILKDFEFRMRICELAGNDKKCIIGANNSFEKELSDLGIKGCN